MSFLFGQESGHFRAGTGVARAGAAGDSGRAAEPPEGRTARVLSADTGIVRVHGGCGSPRATGRRESEHPRSRRRKRGRSGRPWRCRGGPRGHSSQAPRRSGRASTLPDGQHARERRADPAVRCPLGTASSFRRASSRSLRVWDKNALNSEHQGV